MASVRGSGVGLRAALVALAAIVVVGGCSSDKKSGGGGHHIAVTLTDDGCPPQNITTTAGRHTFEVKNAGTSAVTEFEILQGDKIIGEAENVTPGADKSFSLTLKAGTYKTLCPNGKKFHEGTLVVGDATATTTAGSAEGNAAVAAYIAYVQGEGAQLSSAAAPFVLAVKAGDVAGTKRNFAVARYHYETIEPVANGSGDLDWDGFHRIEQAAWAGSLAGMTPVADKLAEVKALSSQVAELAEPLSRIAGLVVAQGS